MLAAVSLTAACATTPVQGPASSGPLRVATTPFTSLSTTGDAGQYLSVLGIAETLTRPTADGFGLDMGMLAAATRTSPTVWDLALRPGVRFQNGAAVDAAAVVAALGADSANAYSADDVNTGTLAVTGALSFTITSRNPAGNIPAQLSDPFAYPIFDVAAAQAAGSDPAALVGRGIYTGPFAPVALDPTGLEATPNPHYWDGPVALPGLDVRFVPDPQARVAAVQNGEVDIALDPPAAAAGALRGDPRAAFVTGPFAINGAWAAMNQNPGSVLADPAVRKAVRAGIDYQGLVAGLGTQTVAAAGMFAPGASYAVDDQVFDPDRARALLDGAGWVPGPDGIRGKAGRRLAFDYLWSPSQGPVHGDLGLVLQQQLREIGVDMQVRQVESTFQPPDATSWGLSVIAYYSASANPHSQLAFLLESPFGNIGGIDDPLLTQLQSSLNAAPPAEQDPLLRRLQQVVADNAYGVVLAHVAPTFVVSPAYRDYQPPGPLRYLGAALRPAA
ncbi:hypothetical protein BJF78_13595 [Pseudonocardia sp. CNS-139]|nr:hypothetical protein BJF78_13595 [Pseudonocardia sp. CNS-139]